MKITLFVFALAVALQNNVEADLIDEVYEKLDELRATVRASITTNVDTVDDLVSTSRTTAKNLYAAAEVDLDQSWTSTWLRILKIKELSVGYNIGVCLQWREDVVLRLPQRCRDDMDTCLAPFDTLLDGISTDTTAKINVLINDIDVFDTQITECNENLLCLSPLIEQMDLASIEVPQKAAVEVENAKTMVADIDVENINCINAGVAYMVSVGTDCADVIEKCANEIVG